MYAKFFGLQQEPFSIAPDPRYLFMSERHRDALAHLLYGVRGGGGFVLLTGEIGAGKTTVCRCFLEQIPKRCNVAYIFNPKLTVNELLRTICEEFHIGGVPAAGAQEQATVKSYLDPLNEFLLKTHAVGQNNVLIIDEAQNLAPEVLEQLRLLTNLETSERKLLQIVLIGQPELRDMLARPELEQLAQRVIARFHLQALSEAETVQYVRHRLGVAGLSGPLPFDGGALRRIHRLARGVPRRINLLCDRALLGAYAHGRSRVDRAIVDRAAAEVFDAGERPARRGGAWPLAAAGGLAALAGVSVLATRLADPGVVAAPPPALVAKAASAAAPAASQALPAAGPDASLSLAPSDAVQAWRELTTLWRVTLSENEWADPCPALKRQQLHCFRSDDGLALLRLLGRPAVLSWRDEETGQTLNLNLLGLQGQSATVGSAGRSQTVSLLALGRQWRGEFITLWRAPPGYQTRLSAGPALDWLDQQLAHVLCVD
eukprot:Opistho-2@2899